MPGIIHHRTAKERSARRGGFTLVELLIVIGIIALLISMLLPALNAARESAKTVTCASNMRNLLLGCMMYANDNRGSLPPGRDGPSDAQRLHTWMLYICKYVGVTPYVGSDYSRHFVRTVFLCPSDYTEWEPPDYSGLTVFFCAKNSYLANNAVMDELAQDVDYDGVVGPRRLSGIPKASETIMLMEGGWDKSNMIGYHNGWPSWFTGARLLGYETDTRSAIGYHRKKNNWGFTDGHVQALNYYQTYGEGFNYWLVKK